jgi:hypothetical protein
MKHALPCPSLTRLRPEAGRALAVSFGQASPPILRIGCKGKGGPAVLSASVSYRVISENLDRSLSNTAKRPQVAREAAHYLANIEKIKSVDDFLANDRVYKFAVKSAGLGEMAYAKAFMRKVLDGGIDDPKSFANSLADKRYREFVKTFNFTRYGATATTFERTRQETVDKYVRQTLEEEAGAQNEGVRLALYFERKAASIESPLGILADKAVLKVVQTALGISEMTAFMDVDKQAEMIRKRLDVADFKDPAKVKTFLNRFINMWDLQQSAATGGGASNALLIGGGGSTGIGANILASIQSLRLGGR